MNLILKSLLRLIVLGMFVVAMPVMVHASPKKPYVDCDSCFSVEDFHVGDCYKCVVYEAENAKLPRKICIKAFWIAFSGSAYPTFHKACMSWAKDEKYCNDMKEQLGRSVDMCCKDHEW